MIALGQLGWSLRRIEATVHIRRETISGYLRAAGIAILPPGGWGRLTPAKPAIEVITDSAMDPELITDPGPPPGRSLSASACEPFRDLIELGLSRGRNAMAIWQDLVDQHGFKATYQSVRRFVHSLQQKAPEYNRFQRLEHYRIKKKALQLRIRSCR